MNESLTRVLKLARWWVDGTQIDGARQVSFTMNTDLASRAISAETINAAVAAWKAGALCRESLTELFRRGEILPDGRTVEQERALIHRGSGASAT